MEWNKVLWNGVQELLLPYGAKRWAKSLQFATYSNEVDVCVAVDGLNRPFAHCRYKQMPSFFATRKGWWGIVVFLDGEIAITWQ